MKNLIYSLISLVKFINKSKEEKKFVFFSESKFYRYHFEDIINELSMFRKNKIFFVCNNKEDYNF